MTSKWVPNKIGVPIGSNNNVAFGLGNLICLTTFRFFGNIMPRNPHIRECNYVHFWSNWEPNNILKNM